MDRRPRVEINEALEFRQFVDKLLQDAAKMLLGYDPSRVTIREKAPGDIVTEADLAVDAFLVAQIRKKFPKDMILSEESGTHGPGESRYAWLLDAIDGSGLFARGEEGYGSMLARTDGDQVIYGAMNAPRKGLQMIAERGKGLYVNGKPFARQDYPTTIRDAKFALANPFAGEGEVELNKLRAEIAQFNTDIDSQYSSVATIIQMLNGQKDVFIINQNHTWDSAPLDVILSEAGFVVSDWRGNPIQWKQPRQHIIAAPESIHASLISKLAS